MTQVGMLKIFIVASLFILLFVLGGCFKSTEYTSQNSASNQSAEQLGAEVGQSAKDVQEEVNLLTNASDFDDLKSFVITGASIS